jgi:uncharacterized membrane protein YczE
MTKYVSKYIAIAVSLVIWTVGTAYAIDSDVTKQTLKGIQGVNVVIEELQPNAQKYAQKFGLQKEQIKADVELFCMWWSIPMNMKSIGMPTMSGSN